MKRSSSSTILYSRNHGDVVLPISAPGVPTREWQPPPGRGAPGIQPGTPPVQQVPTLFLGATRETKTGTIYLKMVNRAGTPQQVRLQIKGFAGISPKGQMIAMSASSPDDTNSITEPRKIVPVTSDVNGLSADFDRTLRPYSITIRKAQSR